MNPKNPLVALALGSALVACVITGAIKPAVVRASDHDDGESEVKARNLNLTDLYVFREKDQNASASETDLIFILNTNPRSVAQQQYYFNTQAKYEFNVTRVTTLKGTPTGKADVTLRFEFGAPATDNTQKIAVTAVRDGVTTSTATTNSGGNIVTTALPGTTETNNAITLGSSTLTVFAGLREDPFFFDVEQYFRVRASAARRKAGSSEAQVTFRSPGVDFAAGYNVLSIVVRVPRTFLQGSTSATIFDVWETITVPNPITVQSLKG